MDSLSRKVRKLYSGLCSVIIYNVTMDKQIYLSGLKFLNCDTAQLDQMSSSMVGFNNTFLHVEVS